MSYPYEEFESESSKLSRAFAKQVAQKDAAIERAERAEKELREAHALAIRMEIERDAARAKALEDAISAVRAAHSSSTDEATGANDLDDMSTSEVRDAYIAAIRALKDRQP
jgi:hypothetical protein